MTEPDTCGTCGGDLSPNILEKRDKIKEVYVCENCGETYDINAEVDAS